MYEILKPIKECIKYFKGENVLLDHVLPYISGLRNMINEIQVNTQSVRDVYDVVIQSLTDRWENRFEENILYLLASYFNPFYTQSILDKYPLKKTAISNWLSLQYAFFFEYTKVSKENFEQEANEIQPIFLAYFLSTPENNTFELPSDNRVYNNLILREFQNEKRNFENVKTNVNDITVKLIFPFSLLLQNIFF